MKNKYIKLWAILITAVASLSATAQWTQIGPYGGGKINALLVNGSNVYAGTANGAFITTNNGGSWTGFNTGFLNPNIVSLGANGSNIFSGNATIPSVNLYSYVYLTTNNSSWSDVSSGLPSYQTQFTAFATAGNKIYLGTAGQGVYVSTNNGTTWTALYTSIFGLQYAIVGALAVDIIGTDTNVFVGTANCIYQSPNNGGYWYADTNGLTNLSINAFTIKGVDIFAGTAGGGVARSNVNGGNWTMVNNGLTALNSTTINALTVEVKGVDTNIFAGTDAGMYISINNGGSWSAVNTGLPPYTLIYSLAVKDTDIFAGSGNGVFLSTNNGSSWAAADQGLSSYGNVNSLVIDTNGADTDIIAGTASGDIFLYSSNNWSWVESSAGGNVDALVETVDGIFSAPGPVLLSTNHGASWSFDYSVINSQVYSLAASGSNIYAGTGSGIFIYDGGGNWSMASQQGLTANCHVLALGIDGQNLFAGTNQFGIYRSTNGGTSFTAVNTGLNTFFSINGFAFEKSGNDTNIFVATDDGVFLSNNDGNTWTAMGGGIYTLVYAIAVDSTNIYAGTYGGGVYISSNNGTTWTPYNTGLTNLYVNALAVEGKHLVAGTNSGVFVTGLAPQQQQQTNGINQIQGNKEQVSVYPNPSNGVFTIGIKNYELGITNRVDIYNVLGEKVYSQSNLANLTFNIDMPSCPSGLYMYKVISEDGSLLGQGKVVIVR